MHAHGNCFRRVCHFSNIWLGHGRARGWSCAIALINPSNIYIRPKSFYDHTHGVQPLNTSDDVSHTDVLETCVGILRVVTNSKDILCLANKLGRSASNGRCHTTRVTAGSSNPRNRQNVSAFPQTVFGQDIFFNLVLAITILTSKGPLLYESENAFTDELTTAKGRLVKASERNNNSDVDGRITLITPCDTDIVGLTQPKEPNNIVIKRSKPKNVMSKSPRPSDMSCPIVCYLTWSLKSHTEISKL